MQAVEFELPHIRLRGLTGGNPDGPLLLALHGWLDNCHSFLPLSPYLEQYQCIFIDFPGHGLSDHRPSGSVYYFIDWVYDIECLIRQQGWQNIHLLGHSMGGYVAEILAAVYPESVRQVTLIEAFGLLTTPAEESRTQLRQGLDSRFKQSQRTGPLYTDTKRLVQARARAGEFDVSHADLLLQRNLKRVEGGYRWRTDPALRKISPFRFTTAQVTGLLTDFAPPMRVILGQQGHQKLEDALAEWGDLIPQKRVHRLPGGHHLHMQHPELVAALLNNTDA